VEHNLRVRIKVSTGRNLQLRLMVRIYPNSMLTMLPDTPECLRQTVHQEILES